LKGVLPVSVSQSVCVHVTGGPVTFQIYCPPYICCWGKLDNADQIRMSLSTELVTRWLNHKTLLLTSRTQWQCAPLHSQHLTALAAVMTSTFTKLPM